MRAQRGVCVCVCVSASERYACIRACVSANTFFRRLGYVFYFNFIFCTQHTQTHTCHIDILRLQYSRPCPHIVRRSSEVSIVHKMHFYGILFLMNDDKLNDSIYYLFTLCRRLLILRFSSECISHMNMNVHYLFCGRIHLLLNNSCKSLQWHSRFSRPQQCAQHAKEIDYGGWPAPRNHMSMKQGYEVNTSEYIHLWISNFFSAKRNNKIIFFRPKWTSIITTIFKKVSIAAINRDNIVAYLKMMLKHLACVFTSDSRTQ